ncbi:hypothetical protein EC957_002728 [Mortierella hygrophila]|uniref:Uncharacterized protein n=1 Tax=Mortierella hygrophila TaxID=979708 RepID=A0A9P6K0W9_9FUNG|nr:hypothetical protein EC957_002728 [Mortierella hygrophila]
MAKEQQSQPRQAVRLLGTPEPKHVEIHANQGRTPIVYWSEIEKQFPNTALAIFAGNGVDFVRDHNMQVLSPLRIKSQHPAEIIVQLVDTDYNRQLGRDLEKYHDANIAQHKFGHAMLNNVLLNVKSGIRALFDLPNHSIPRMFIVIPEPTSKRNLANIVSRSYRLFFLCECGDSAAAATSTIDGGVSHKMHFAHHEGYEIRTPKAFIQKYGSHMMKLLDMIQKLAPVSGAAILNSSTLPSEIQKVLKATDDNCLPRIKEIANHLQQVLNSTDDTIDANLCQVLDGPDLRAIESFLIRKDDNRSLGNLHRILTPDYNIKWVCDQHVEENANRTNMEVLQHAIRIFGGALDKKRGLVTVRLSYSNAEEFFRLIGKEPLIQELDITLDFGPSTEQIRTLRQNMKCSHVSSLSININVPGSKHNILGMRKVGGAAQLLKLLELGKVGKPGPFRNLSVKGVPDILEGHEFEKCLAYSLAMDQESFNWEREKSRQRLLLLLNKASDLSNLRLCSSTLSEGYDMVQQLARKSHRLTTIHITTTRQGHIEFGLKAGSIEAIAGTVQASELSTVVMWEHKLERLTVMTVDDHESWPMLETIIIQNHGLARLDLYCPVNRFCSIFQQVTTTAGPNSNLGTLCLRHGDSELLTKDLSDPIATTTIKMLPEEERDLGMWTTYSLFGFFPAYDAKPCLLTEEQVLTLQDHFQSVNGPICLQEVNLDVSNLSWHGFRHLNTFLNKHSHIRVRLSGVWTEDIHNDFLSRLGGRLSGFDMTVLISGTNPLAKRANTLFNTLTRIRNAVSTPGAKLRFMTDKGNTINIPDLQNPNSASFDIIQDDEPFDFALTRYFGLLPSKLFCDNGFSDTDVPILQSLIAQCPSRLRYLSLSITGLDEESMDKVGKMVFLLSSDAEIRIEWNGDKDRSKHKANAKAYFLISVAHRTNELDLSNINNLYDLPPTLSWPVLRSVSLRNIHGSHCLLAWIQLMVASKWLRTVSLVSLKELGYIEWGKVLVKMNFAGLESLKISSSHLPVELLPQLVDRVPRASGCLSKLMVECDEIPRKGWFGRKKTPIERIDFQQLVWDRAPTCSVTIDYNWIKEQ